MIRVRSACLSQAIDHAAKSINTVWVGMLDASRHYNLVPYLAHNCTCCLLGCTRHGRCICCSSHTHRRNDSSGNQRNCGRRTGTCTGIPLQSRKSHVQNSRSEWCSYRRCSIRCNRTLRCRRCRFRCCCTCQGPHTAQFKHQIQQSQQSRQIDNQSIRTANGPRCMPSQSHRACGLHACPYATHQWSSEAAVAVAAIGGGVVCAVAASGRHTPAHGRIEGGPGDADTRASGRTAGSERSTLNLSGAVISGPALVGAMADAVHAHKASTHLQGMSAAELLICSRTFIYTHMFESRLL